MKIRLAILVISCSVLAACHDTKNSANAALVAANSSATVDNQTVSAQAATQLSIANPASENCIKLGGQLMIKKDANGGAYGVCKFANGKECEEWALFRHECSAE